MVDSLEGIWGYGNSRLNFRSRVKQNGRTQVTRTQGRAMDESAEMTPGIYAKTGL